MPYAENLSKLNLLANRREIQLENRKTKFNGSALVYLIAAAFTLTAFLIWLILPGPDWAKAEAVLIAWFLIWGAVLSFLLYRGWIVESDAKPGDFRYLDGEHYVIYIIILWAFRPAANREHPEQGRFFSSLAAGFSHAGKFLGPLIVIIYLCSLLF